MATKKQSAGPAKAVAKANETALTRFPKTKVRSTFETMAGCANDSDAANEAKQNAALELVRLAHLYREANAEATTETVVTGWRDNLKLVTMELAVSGNKFAELSPSKDDKPATAKLTGYGNNVASIAKGSLEFGIAPLDSYRDTRKAVEAARAEARRAADPDAALIADAKQAACEAWDGLRKAVFDTGDLELIRALTVTLDQMRDECEMAQAEADKLEAMAEAV